MSAPRGNWRGVYENKKERESFVVSRALEPQYPYFSEIDEKPSFFRLPRLVWQRLDGTRGDRPCEFIVRIA